MVNRNVEPFNLDIEHNVGYLYTTNIKLSSSLATQRTTDIILGLNCFTGKSVIDMGCGDGYYTLRFWDQGNPSSLTAVDLAEKAVELANAKKGNRPIVFEVGDAHHLSYPNDSFEVALIQSILHHDDNPSDIIREAFRVAKEILIHEPNGHNFGLKIIEKTSAYHREHAEKSYTFRQVSKWVEQAGGRVVGHRFAGFVPMFCPDGLAKVMKRLEPIIENTPLLRPLGCAVYALVAVRH